MSLRDLIPTTPEQWSAVHAYVTERQPGWRLALKGGRTRLAERLIGAGYDPVSLPCEGLGVREVLVQARLKTPERILRTMRLDRIPLAQVPDVFGYRVVMSAVGELEPVAALVADLWEPAPSRFAWWQDWTTCDPGRGRDQGSLATTEAIHLARQDAREVQVVTWTLYERTYLLDGTGEGGLRPIRDRTPR